jgi:predicted nucleic acid-binding Zn ribbon protein
MMRYYSCPMCGEIEDYRKDTEIRTTCPICESRVVQQYGFSFKLVGPGFYANDSKPKTSEAV